MKIRVHEIECYVGYARPIFRGIYLPKIEAEIADVCRKDWSGRDWDGYWETKEKGLTAEQKEELEESEGYGETPPIPSMDAEVIATYFYDSNEDSIADDDDGSAYWIFRNYYDLDLSPEPGVPIDLTVDTNPFTVTRDEAARSKGRAKKRLIEAGAHTTGTLMEESGLVGDALESFVMQLTAAGFPVHLPEFKTCLRDCCVRIADEMDEPAESMELALSNAGLLIGRDLAYDSWVVNRIEGESCVLVKGQPACGFKTRNEAVAFAFELT